MEEITFVKKYLSSNKKMIEINMFVNGFEVGYCNLSITNNSFTQETYYDLQAISIYPKYRKKGYANKLMESVIKHVKRSKYNIKLKAEPFDDKPLTILQLKKFYKSFGFINCNTSKIFMIWNNPKIVNLQLKST